MLFATFQNTIQVWKIGTFQGNLSTIFLKVLNIYLFSKIFQKVEIAMLQQYFNCNEILEIFLTSFCNILCYRRKKTSLGESRVGSQSYNPIRESRFFTRVCGLQVVGCKIRCSPKNI